MQFTHIAWSYNICDVQWIAWLKQESLANAKVSARQLWYIGRNSLNRPPLIIASPSNINEICTSLKSTYTVPLAMALPWWQNYKYRCGYYYYYYYSAQQFPRWQCGSIFIRLAVVASKTCQLAQIPRKFEVTAVQGHPRSMILVTIESAYATSY